MTGTTAAGVVTSFVAVFGILHYVIAACACARDDIFHGSNFRDSFHADAYRNGLITPSCWAEIGGGYGGDGRFAPFLIARAGI